MADDLRRAYSSLRLPFELPPPPEEPENLWTHMREL